MSISPDYIKKMDYLRKAVSNYTTKNTGNNNIVMHFSNINFKSPILYIIVPFIVMFLLLIIRPSFVTLDSVDINNEVKRKLSFNKIVISTLVIGMTINIAIFTYNKKRD